MGPSDLHWTHIYHDSDFAWPAIHILWISFRDSKSGIIQSNGHKHSSDVALQVVEPTDNHVIARRPHAMHNPMWHYRCGSFHTTPHHTTPRATLCVVYDTVMNQHIDNRTVGNKRKNKNRKDKGTIIFEFIFCKIR